MRKLSEFTNVDGYEWGRKTVEARPEIMKLAAELLAACSMIEAARAQVFFLSMPDDTEAAMAVYDTIESRGNKQKALMAASKIGLTRDAFSILLELEMRSNQVLEFRDKLSHWIWASCTAVPEAILLVPNKYKKDLVLTFPKYGGLSRHPPMLMPVPHDKVEVYTATELRSIADSGWDCVTNYYKFFSCVSFALGSNDQLENMKDDPSTPSMVLDVHNELKDAFNTQWAELQRLGRPAEQATV